jgi:hypothetical protein
MTQDTIAPAFSPFACTLQEAALFNETLSLFIRNNFVIGVDYGIVPGTSKEGLFKSGAEKIALFLALAPTYEVVHRDTDFNKGFVAYEVKCALRSKRTGEIVAEGLGCCNSKERKYKTQDAANIANTILKMAKKRACVDAVLQATGSRFEAAPEEGEEWEAPQATPAPARPPARPQQQQQPRAANTQQVRPQQQQSQQQQQQAPAPRPSNLKRVPGAPGNAPLGKFDRYDVTTLDKRGCALALREMANDCLDHPQKDDVRRKLVELKAAEVADEAGESGWQPDRPDLSVPPADYDPNGRVMDNGWTKANGIKAVQDSLSGKAPLRAVPNPHAPQSAPPKRGLPNHVTSLIIAAEEAGLDMSERARHNRWQATQGYYQVQSWKDLTPAQAQMLRTEIREGRFTWPPAGHQQQSLPETSQQFNEPHSQQHDSRPAAQAA